MEKIHGQWFALHLGMKIRPSSAFSRKAYQKRKGLTADGIVGPKTWNMLF
ncbi:peptidoglycan-binding domain-containing protein [Geobacillus icigianus]